MYYFNTFILKLKRSIFVKMFEYSWKIILIFIFNSIFNYSNDDITANNSSNSIVKGEYASNN